MSHFPVLVTRTDKESIDSQLERFYEQGEEDDYFMEKKIEFTHEDMKNEAQLIIERYKKSHIEAVQERRKAKRTFRDTHGWAKDKWTEMELERKAGYNNHYLKDADEAQALFDKGDYPAIVQEYHGGSIDEVGNLYFVSNEEAKWDWYTIGGRWRGYFKLKKGKEGILGSPGVYDNDGVYDADIAKVKDIDWEYMKAMNRMRAAKRWAEYEKEKELGNKPLHPGRNLSDSKDDKETFIKKAESVAPFAILHNDEWLENGKMGWFAIVSDQTTPEDWDKVFWQVINSLDPETELTIVDCHI